MSHTLETEEQDISFEDLINITCEQALKRLVQEKEQISGKKNYENYVDVTHTKTVRNTASSAVEQVPAYHKTIFIKHEDDCEPEAVKNENGKSEDSLEIDPKLISIPAVYTTKLEDMGFFHQESLISVKNKCLIDFIEYLSNPVRRKSKNLQIMDKNGCINIETSDDDGVEENNISDSQKGNLASGLFKKPDDCINIESSDEESNTNESQGVKLSSGLLKNQEECIINIESSDDDGEEENNISETQKVKLTSGLFKKPYIRNYNVWDLYKNPDFNATHKNLNPEFYCSSRNIEMLNCCKRLTIDLSKSFESKLVNGRIYLKGCKENGHSEPNSCDTGIQQKTSLNKLDCATNYEPFLDSLRHTNPSSIDACNAKEFMDIQEIPKRNTVINLPNMTEVRRINQRLLTAEVPPVQTQYGLQMHAIDPVTATIDTKSNTNEMSASTLNTGKTTASISLKSLPMYLKTNNIHNTYEQTKPLTPLVIKQPKKFRDDHLQIRGTNTKIDPQFPIIQHNVTKFAVQASNAPNLELNCKKEYIADRNEIVLPVNNDLSQIIQKKSNDMSRPFTNKLYLVQSNRDSTSIDPDEQKINYSPEFTTLNNNSNVKKRETSDQNSEFLLLPTDKQLILHRKGEAMHYVESTPNILTDQEKLDTTAVIPTPANNGLKQISQSNIVDISLAGVKPCEYVNISQLIEHKTKSEGQGSFLKLTPSNVGITPKLDNLKHTYIKDRIDKANIDNAIAQPLIPITKQYKSYSVANPQTVKQAYTIGTNRNEILKKAPVVVRIAPKLTKDQIGTNIVIQPFTTSLPLLNTKAKLKPFSLKKINPIHISHKEASLKHAKTLPKIGMAVQNAYLIESVNTADPNPEQHINRLGSKGKEESRKRVYANILKTQPKKRKTNVQQSENELALQTSYLNMSPDKSNEGTNKDTGSWVLLGL